MTSLTVKLGALALAFVVSLLASTATKAQAISLGRAVYESSVFREARELTTEYKATLPRTLPLWRDPQLRVRTSVQDSGLEDFELGYRVSRRSKKENDAILRRYEIGARIANLRQQRVFENTLRDAYLLAVDVAYHRSVKQRLIPHYPVIQMNTLLSEAELVANPRDTLQFVSAVRSSQKHEQRIQSTDYKLTYARLELDRLTDSSIQIGSYSDFIDPATAIRRIADLGQIHSTSREILSLENSQSTIRDAITEARSELTIDFVETRWGSIGEDNKFTVSLGINLPWQKGELATANYEARIRALEYAQKIKSDKASTFIALELKDKRMQVLRSQLEDLKIPAQKLSRAVQGVDGGTRLFVRLRQELLDLELQSLEIQAELYREYIGYLHVSGLLGLDPDENWLAPPSLLQ